ncbi:MAG: hypothetical protein NT120_02390 [Candidatus Aenigmarchaeota archaeon]|nr:hypothetical protein [Candidatus Aenigmarchaeota archaeon]
MTSIVEDIGGTLIVLIGVIVILFAAILVLLAFQVKSPSGTLSTSAEFLSFFNKPYGAATALSQYNADDRQFFEHAIEISAVGAENTGSEDLVALARRFLNYYETTSYIAVAIKKKDNLIFSTNTIPNKCGDNLEGYCVNSRIARYARMDPSCGLGRKEITAGKNGCGMTETCCADDLANTNTMPCGPRSGSKYPGVCDYNIGAAGTCPEGRTIIPDEDDTCKKFGGTASLLGLQRVRRVCCAPIGTPNIGTTTTAYVPLIFVAPDKTSLSVLEVTAG